VLLALDLGLEQYGLSLHQRDVRPVGFVCGHCCLLSVQGNLDELKMFRWLMSGQNSEADEYSTARHHNHEGECCDNPRHVFAFAYPHRFTLATSTNINALPRP
jgi:hypothetical protein